MTFEQLYLNSAASGIGRAYTDKRKAKVAAIARYLRGHVLPTASRKALAEAVMADAEYMGRFDGDTVYGEVAGRYTVTGNPLPLTV